jgi:hypothetical protein
MVAVRTDVHVLWWIPTGALGCAGVLLLAAVWPRTFNIGPDTRRFYETMGASLRLDATRQMLSDLLAAIDENDSQLPSKNRLFKVGFGLLVIAPVGSSAVALA